MTRTLLLTFSLSTCLVACGPSAGSSVGDSCEAGQSACSGDAFLVCQNGELALSETCTGNQFCEPTVGCEDVCQTGQNVCLGNEVRTCQADGTYGEVVEACTGLCAGGMCTDETGCAGGAAEFVYVVDNANQLYAFDPAGDAHTFTTVGTLTCPAGDPIGGPLLGPATPFSMSVDRSATAWVLYSSGELFNVSTETAACTATSFQSRQMQYDLFGMGFVSDTVGSSAEKLFVTGSTLNELTGALENTKIGYIDPQSLAVTHLQNMPPAEYPPELTGTGDAKLYGYFPGNSSTVAEIDKTTGQTIAGRSWPAGSIGGTEQLLGWAFAQWGGRFYVFVTTQDLFGPMVSKVVRVDPDANGGAGEAITVKDTAVPFIVGAGVSTCAPIVVE